MLTDQQAIVRQPVPEEFIKTRLRHIEAFLRAAETGTNSAAARMHNVSQPALSKTMSDLEAEQCIALFKRTGRRTILTPEGEVFRCHALAAVQSFEAGCRVPGGLRAPIS